MGFTRGQDDRSGDGGLDETRERVAGVMMRAWGEMLKHLYSNTDTSMKGSVRLRSIVSEIYEPPQML